MAQSKRELSVLALDFGSLISGKWYLVVVSSVLSYYE